MEEIFLDLKPNTATQNNTLKKNSPGRTILTNVKSFHQKPTQNLWSFFFFTPHSLHINVKQHITKRLSICTPCCWFEEKSQSHKIVWHGLKLLNARVPVPWTRGELLNFWMEENSWTLNQRGAWLQCNLLWMEMDVEHLFRRSWSRCGIFSFPSQLSVQTLLVCTQLLCAITWITICAQVNNSKPWQPYYCLDTWKYSTQPSKMECSCPSGTGTDNCYMQKMSLAKWVCYLNKKKEHRIKTNSWKQNQRWTYSTVSLTSV